MQKFKIATNINLKTMQFSAMALLSATILPKELPREIAKQIPKDYSVIVYATGDFDKNQLDDYIVATASNSEDATQQDVIITPPRILLVFMQKEKGKYVLTDKNKHVIYPMDAGGQCDPFIDNGIGNGITVKPPFFTVENGVACGNHWTHYITFKYSKTHQAFVLHNSIYENNEILSRKSTRSVERPPRGKPILLKDYRPY